MCVCRLCCFTLAVVVYSFLPPLNCSDVDPCLPKHSQVWTCIKMWFNLTGGFCYPAYEDPSVCYYQLFTQRQSNASYYTNVMCGHRTWRLTSNVSYSLPHTSEITAALLNSCLAGLPDNRPPRTFIMVRYVLFSAWDGKKHTISPICCRLLSFLLAAYKIVFLYHCFFFIIISFYICIHFFSHFITASNCHSQRKKTDWISSSFPLLLPTAATQTQNDLDPNCPTFTLWRNAKGF